MPQDQFLQGEKGGTPTTIAGVLRLPGTAMDTQKRPAVILLPGLGGSNISHDRWADDLSRMGVAVFLIDSFAGRSFYTMAEQGRVPAPVRMLDAFAALDLLRKHPQIDPARIAVMGFSHGAAAALYSSNERFTKAHAPEGIQFAAHIAVYGSCHIKYRDDTRTTGKPIRMFHGIADDWVPVEPCRSYVDRLRQSGADVTLTEYPDAYHVYDNPGFSTEPIKFPQVATAGNCPLAENDVGQIVNTATGKPLDPNDSCMRRGTHIAYNAAAHQATVQAVQGFLKQVFQLN
jgi:dienelactone hydrolase